jgi:hypothetical protein
MKGFIKGVLPLFGLILGAVAPARADLAWYCDPNTAPTFGDTRVGGDNNNTFFQTYMVRNITAMALPEIAFISPIWQVSNALQWDDARGGWAGNVGGTTLFVTVNTPDRLPFSEVADPSGTMQQMISQFGQTVLPSDHVPFLDLGSFQPNETKTFELAYHYQWGDNRSGVADRAAFVETISPNPVPEPAGLTLFGLGALGLLGYRRRSRKPAAA